MRGSVLEHSTKPIKVLRPEGLAVYSTRIYFFPGRRSSTKVPQRLVLWEEDGKTGRHFSRVPLIHRTNPTSDTRTSTYPSSATRKKEEKRESNGRIPLAEKVASFFVGDSQLSQLPNLVTQSLSGGSVLVVGNFVRFPAASSGRVLPVTFGRRRLF